MVVRVFNLFLDFVAPRLNILYTCPWFKLTFFDCFFNVAYSFDNIFFIDEHSLSETSMSALAIVESVFVPVKAKSFNFTFSCSINSSAVLFISLSKSRSEVPGIQNFLPPKNVSRINHNYCNNFNLLFTTKIFDTLNMKKSMLQKNEQTRKHVCARHGHFRLPISGQYYTVDATKIVHSRFRFDCSLKNIPIPSRDNYMRNLIEKVEGVLKRMRWKAHFFLKGEKKPRKPQLFRPSV